MSNIVKPVTLQCTLPVVDDIEDLELGADTDDELSSGKEEGEEDE